MKKSNRLHVGAWAPARPADPDLQVIRQAMDVFHVQLVALEHNGHVCWCWSGHDPEDDSRTWPTREDAVREMRESLRGHEQSH